MAKFNLVTIRPRGFLHSDSSADVRNSLAWSLTALGHEVISSECAFARGPVTNIVFHAELLAPDSELPGDAILYNLEQPSHPNMAGVRSIAQGHIVWDYSQRNVQDWERLGIQALHLPIGYTPNLTRVPHTSTQDIDVCFLGWLTPRRRKIISDLQSSGLNVYASDCCYGGARDQILSRTKVCLNVHHDNRDRFEIVRVSYLLANQKCVVTESSSDESDYDFFHGDINPYDNLVYACSELVRHPHVRHEMEIGGEGFIQQRDFTLSVASVLNGHLTSPIRTRYEAGCREGDMKDFLPTLRGLAKGNVLEIGVRDGASTSAFLLGLEERGGRLTSIDITDCSGLWQHKQWNFLQRDSKHYQPDMPFDLAFIDGDHSPEGFLADLHNCLQWVKPGGIILCHDITPVPNYTKEAAGGEWPSEFVGKQFFSECERLKLRHFVHPGAWGLGVIIKDL